MSRNLTVNLLAIVNEKRTDQHIRLSTTGRNVRSVSFYDIKRNSLMKRNIVWFC